MRGRFLFIAWMVLAFALAFLSFYYHDGTEAMVAQVESQSTTISYLKPVIIKRLNSVPGQSVKKGDLLLEVFRPDLQLDIDQAENEIHIKQSDLKLLAFNYASKRDELLIGFQNRLEELNSNKQAIETQINQSTYLVNKISPGSAPPVDSLLLIKLKQLNTAIAYEKSKYQQSKADQQIRFLEEKEIIETQIQLLEKKREFIFTETENLIQFAPFDGIIGTVEVREGELVSPYTKVMTLFENSPTLIKAFMNERIEYDVNIGQIVAVESENRLYKIQGKVIELGARITSYPTKLEPFATRASYGREVFIEISGDNQFLNGEKVFVYPATQ